MNKREILEEKMRYTTCKRLYDYLETLKLEELVLEDNKIVEYLKLDKELTKTL